MNANHGLQTPPRIKPAGWVLIAVIVLGLIGLGLHQGGLLAKLVPAKKVVSSVIPTEAALPNAPAVAPAAARERAAAPGNIPARIIGPLVRIAGWAWNAQAGFWYAMGGVTPTEGSLMAKYDVNVEWYRQDDDSVMQKDLITCAKELASGATECKKGAAYVSIMWDGAPAFVTAVNSQLQMLGPEYTVEFIGSGGYSRGEDKFMGKPEWRDNPQLLKGALVAGVLRQGDWNIALKFLGDNKIRNNPDETTYDPDALNWYATTGYIEAAKAYISGVCENRPEVKDGKRTGRTVRVCVDGVVTWTPGDVMVAQEKGGLVSIVSTAEYAAQMPNAIIGIRKFGRLHPQTVINMLDAILQGGDAIKSDPAALTVAARVSAAAYNEEDAAYWQRYYHIVPERDKQGLSVTLGGSSVNNLADNLELFGLSSGSANIAKIVYGAFSKILVQQYPTLVPNVWPVDDVINPAYLSALQQKYGNSAKPAERAIFAERPIEQVISKRSWSINFRTGSAQFTQEAMDKLEELFGDLVVARNLAVEVDGHTDSVGTPDRNMTLSEQRAFAVKRWLEERSPSNFPSSRTRIRAFGQTMPVEPNDTEYGRAANRRVEIILGVQ